jgi:rod shape-determining protein MreC
VASFGRTRRAQPSFIRPFAILIALSLVLLLSRNSEPVRAIATGATGLLVPIQRVLADIGVTTNRFVQAITEIETLRADNAALRNAVDRLTLENVQLREAAFAAQQAAKLNEVAKGLKFETVAAPVIARDPSNVLATIVLGAGTDGGIKVGHVVVSEQGLVGRVSEVGPNYSKVLLITDPSSTLSALVEGSRATGIVHGQYGDSLIMDWILQTERVSPGDVVVTAGLGLGEELRSLYPKGLVVGRVLQLQNAEAAAYQRAIIAPAVDLRRLENVLVVRTTP